MRVDHTRPGGDDVRPVAREFVGESPAGTSPSTCFSCAASDGRRRRLQELLDVGTGSWPCSRARHTGHMSAGPVISLMFTQADPTNSNSRCFAARVAAKAVKHRDDQAFQVTGRSANRFSSDVTLSLPAYTWGPWLQ